MQKFFLTYAVTLVSFVLIDGIWLGLVAKNFYKKHLGFIMTSQVQWWAAIVFYLLFIAGLVIFVLLPHLQSGTPLYKVFLFGALFGLVTYATYDLTNQATLQDWPVIVTTVDLLWGTVLGGLVSSLSYFIISRFT